jgi:hypothetical protein
MQHSLYFHFRRLWFFRSIALMLMFILDRAADTLA